MVLIWSFKLLFFSFLIPYDLFIVFIIWTICLYACMCIMFMSGAFWDQKRELGPLKLELQKVVNYYVVAGNWIWILWKASY